MDLSRLWLFLLSWLMCRFEIYFAVPIYGGKLLSTECSYQFIVSLQDVTPKGSYAHFCGGSLLNKRWILTAAHCLWRKNIRDVVALMGSEISDISEISAVDDLHKLDRIEYNNFAPITFQNDIALARLRHDFTPKSGNFDLKPAKLPELGMKANRNHACTIIGYGALGHFGIASNPILLAAKVHVISNKQCRQKMGRVWAPQKHHNTVCALGDHQDACQGDSGGPLICEYEQQQYVYGLVSHGIACGGKGIPSIYTVTVPYTNWIKTIIAK